MINEKKTKHVLGLSGGKDSAALAIYMAREYPEIDIDYFFTDTGYELPEVYEFVDELESLLGKPILRLNHNERVVNSDVKVFNKLLVEHNNYLPSGRQRWCTIKMKLEPFEKWINPFLREGYEVYSYVGIRADEPWRDGFIPNEAQKNLKIKMPFAEDGIKRAGVISILDSAGIGLPKYYEWRSRSGCTFCFFQRKIEWVRLMERYPEAFEEAKAFEKQAETSENGETFYWMGPNEPLTTLENPERVTQIKENHEKSLARFEKKKAREKKRRLGLHSMVDESQIIDTLYMDEIYDDLEGGGACVTCYK
ncbi:MULTISPECIES: phosphoadenosine phosphosulfate reductase family protein [Vibrio]|uniref:phosphoadenosine phosphosulfate reductase domain-containing protein n=1 Tax=Vibrio TaxID=662 RepID=UPI0015935BA8|nr:MULTISPECIES: phosphoadenosine phosphosulfate reductase family protein [Vibrio]MCA3903321.1 phosphoadenosine phosphosulfate reductase family protein [Vibrio vulnificus]MDE1233955.1 phosphoadenosine phosphosulfate reductase family protein [Vibrio aestuarianus]MDE1244832.1 phosphoadenosine phosphosulfate reductase family protein [Vibrio aestuarianus]NGZ62072.1 phosphoadenosine phosphosulfate reductase family protein [Vibrio aestuarianus subsp. cardii]